jgi:hypothetical protein
VAEQDQHVPGTCHSDQHCRAHDGKTAYPTSDPLCPDCLEAAQPDVKGLLYDYLDLAQLHAPAMSQAPSEHTSGGSTEAAIPLAVHVDELQAEIVHALSTWEYEIRVACRLHDPGTFAPLWRSTVYDHFQLGTRNPQTHKARAGSVVQRAVATLLPRLDRLARLPATVVCPRGIEDEPVEMAGWEAVHHLQSLHNRARGALGRTTRKFWIPGECWACDARPTPGQDGPLYRSEPREYEDAMQVNCTVCGNSRPYADYETYMTTVLWPDAGTDANVRVAA